jgi:ABC-type glycerol-3-phosphate transport system substrate-binding protein
MNRKLRPLAALALIAMVALISACGSSAPAETGSGSSSGGNNSAANAQKAVKFAVCMRNNGVSEFPDPATSGKFTIDGVANGSSLDPSAPAFKQAINACKDLEPAGFMGSKRSPQQQEAALKFAQCMRAKGVPDFPDPTPNGPLIDTNRIPSAAGRGARSIPGFQAAAHKCTAIYSGELGLGGQ